MGKFGQKWEDSLRVLPLVKYNREDLFRAQVEPPGFWGKVLPGRHQYQQGERVCGYHTAHVFGQASGCKAGLYRLRGKCGRAVSFL